MAPRVLQPCAMLWTATVSTGAPAPSTTTRRQPSVPARTRTREKRASGAEVSNFPSVTRGSRVRLGVFAQMKELWSSTRSPPCVWLSTTKHSHHCGSVGSRYSCCAYKVQGMPRSSKVPVTASRAWAGANLPVATVATCACGEPTLLHLRVVLQSSRRRHASS